MFENVRADFKSHGSSYASLGFWALAVYRFGRWRHRIPWRWLRMPFSALYRLLYFLVQIAAGIEIDSEVKIGKNFIIDHGGGIVVSGYTKFGDNCRIRTGVVIGLARVEDPCAPVIGDNVDIGAGAKLLGAITVGNNVLIGANAVVTRNVPSNSVAVGVPARILAQRSRRPRVVAAA